MLVNYLFAARRSFLGVNFRAEGVGVSLFSCLERCSKRDVGSSFWARFTYLNCEAARVNLAQDGSQRSFSYSTRACRRTGTLESASIHSAKNFSNASLACALSPDNA